MNNYDNNSTRYGETFHSIFWGVLILIGIFILLYLPWVCSERELFRKESLYAVMAAEFNFSNPVTTAHQIMIRNGFPVYPALVTLTNKVFGLSMEMSLRMISVVMLAALAVLSAVATAKRRTPAAGLVTAAMIFGTQLALEKVVDGSPKTTAAFFLLTAQLIFFHFGCRRAEWNRAWIVAIIPLVFGFLTGGLIVVILFFFPMIFFRRPLSAGGKFSKPGFAIAIAMLLIAMLGWIFPYWVSPDKTGFEYFWLNDFQINEYFFELLAFPVWLILRLLPWSVLAWMPFCVALQSLDKTPVFNAYLRTLVFSSLAFLWLLPDHSPDDLIFILGPLGILCGTNYELGVRRYGWKLRRLLVAGGYIVALFILTIVAVWVLPEDVISQFASITNTLNFRNKLSFTITAAISIMTLVLLGWYYQRMINRRPLWLLLNILVAVMGIFYATIKLPYCSQVREKRNFGADIQRALQTEPPIKLLYKCNIADLYGGLYYAHIPVKKIKSLTDLPAEPEIIYLITPEFPQFSKRSWSRMLPENYTYQEHPVALWKGILRPKVSETKDTGEFSE